MIPFAIVVRWTGESSISEAERLLDPVQHHCSDGRTAAVVPGAAFAVGLRAVGRGETIQAGVTIDSERQRMIVGDASLYGGQEHLGIPGDVVEGTTDLARILHAYNRAGENSFSQLVGDFAFVIWDWGQRKLVAARDHFGLRLLYFRRLPDGLAFATDVRQLLAMDADERKGDPEVDPEMALDYLLRDFVHAGRSFFRNIRQVRPAHVLTGARGLVRQRRYWEPRLVQIQREQYTDYVDEWRSWFRTSVTERLRSDHPIAAHLSGGLDSGSVVRAAHDVYAADLDLDSPFYTLSAEFPGLECDESAQISAVSRQLPRFTSIRWNGCDANLIDLENPMVAAPGLRRGLGGGPDGDLQSARERGARVLLSGFGGDELFWTRGIFRDLVAHLQVRTLISELAALPSRARMKSQLLDGLRGIFPPGLLAPLRRGSARRGRAPAWLGPDLVEIFPGEEDEADRTDHKFRSHVQRELWRFLQAPQSGVFIEFFVLAAREAGLEIRMPFLDVRLAEFILAIPWEQRLPRGDMRRLQRDGVRAFLPPRVLHNPKVVGGSAWARHAETSLPRVREVLHDRTWVCGRFVNQSAAQGLVSEIAGSQPPALRSRNLRQAWAIASFEVWLRTVRGYTAASRAP
jgi:asparagine synthase (glutamine-hydrolysing)